MSTQEKKRILLNVIQALDDRITAHYKAHTYDGVKAPEERMQDVALLESHMYWARKALTYLNSQDVA